MKMSRTDLKDLIKECLVEILAEGIGDTLTEAVAQPRRRGKTGSKYRSMTRPARSKKATAAQGTLPTAALQQAVEESAHGNPVMADILADTAMTTLPQMLAGAAPPRPGSPESVMAESEPEEVFGENVDRWANLAFDSQSRSAGMFTPPPPATSRKLSAAELDAPVVGPKKTA
jgi:hypothetical protein